MAIKIACVHCGFIFEDEDMEVCPVCGTELGKEWNPAELQSFVVTELSEQQAEVVGKLVHKSAKDVSKELAVDGCFGLNDLTPVQVETWGNQLKTAGIEFTVENSAQKALRIQKTLDARTAEAEIKKAQAEAKAQEAEAKRAEKLAEAKKAAAVEAEKLAAAKQADAERAAQLAAVKNADAATEKARLAAEAEVKKAEAEAKAQAEAVRLAEEERLKREAKAIAEAKAAEEAAVLAQQKAATEAAAEAERNREIVCHSCGKSYKHTKKFCPECGAPNKELNPDKWVCSKCKKEYSEPTKFCEECGGAVKIVEAFSEKNASNEKEKKSVDKRTFYVLVIIGIAFNLLGLHNIYLKKGKIACQQLVVSLCVLPLIRFILFHDLFYNAIWGSDRWLGYRIFADFSRYGLGVFFSDGGRINFYSILMCAFFFVIFYWGVRDIVIFCKQSSKK